MKNVYPLTPKSAKTDSLEQASVWIARLERGLTGEENDTLEKWLLESPEHREALQEASDLWGRLDSLKRLADLFPEQRHDRKRSWHSIGAAAAAVLLLVGFITINLNNDPSGMVKSPMAVGNAEVYEKSFETAKGEKSTVSLPDGSQLMLNTGSEVQVNYQDDQRAVYLTRGEINIHVEHNPARPFNVYVGNKVVQAVGTAFNLEITHDNEVELIVTEGRVIVGVAGRVKDSSPNRHSAELGAIQEKPSLQIAAGEQILLGSENEQIERLEPEEINVKLSWRGGNLVFKGESLADAIAEIERYTPVQFIIQGEDLQRISVAGMFKAGDVDGLLSTLKANFNVNSKRVNKRKIILTRSEVEGNAAE